MRCPKKLAQPEKVFPATMAHTTSLWNLSGGAGVVAVCGAMLVAVCGVTLLVAVYGVTDSTVAGKESLQHGAVRFLMLIGH
jgi:hypothetical protein